jgi:tetratricopeptide (TPR) repeat protein
VLKYPARAFLLLFLGAAFFLTVRMAVAEAEFRRSPESAWHTPFWIRAENLARFDSSPDELRAALNLNPRLSSAWIDLGLNAEADGDLPDAEADLLQASLIDRQYLPAWTLANFYFRRGDRAKFWPWARRAAALTYDDYRPLLRMADALDTSPQEVATRLGGASPLLRAYLDVLIGAGRLDSAQEVAILLSARHDPYDRARLADFADRKLRAEHRP